MPPPFSQINGILRLFWERKFFISIKVLLLLKITIFPRLVILFTNSILSPYEKFLVLRKVPSKSVKINFVLGIDILIPLKVLFI